jgi:type IV pilus assembly protein PilY1
MKTTRTAASSTLTSRIRHLAGAAMVGTLATLAAPNLALATTDDTEVLIAGDATPPNATNKPRVLFVLDTSGSMSTTVAGTGATRLENLKRALIGLPIGGGQRDNSGIFRNEKIFQGINAGLLIFGGFHNYQPIRYPVTELTALNSTVEGGTDTTKTARDRIVELVEATTANGGTPIVPVLYEAARYYKGLSVDLGSQSARYRNQTPNQGISHVASQTGGTPQNYTLSGGGFNNDGQPCNMSTGAGCEYYAGTPVYKSPLTVARLPNATDASIIQDNLANQCKQADYIIFLTDGQPTQNDATIRSNIRTMTGDTSCIDYADNNFECGREVAKHIFQTDLRSTVDGKQYAILDTIGFNLTEAEAPGAQAYLAALAADGGGKTYSANTASQLVDVFLAILGGALNESRSFNPPALTINSFSPLENRDNVYVSLFKPAMTQNWRGNLKKYKICLQTNCTVGTETLSQGEYYSADEQPLLNPSTGLIDSTTQSFWSPSDPDNGGDTATGGALSRMPLPANRNIYTFTGAYSGNVATGTTDLSNAVNRVAADAVVGTITNPSLTNAMLNVANDTERKALIDWIRGVDVDNEDNNATTTTRHMIADPLHAQAVVVSYGGASSAPIEKVFLPTNGGGLHMFNAASIVGPASEPKDTTNGGVEEWMFIPQELLPYQKIVRANTSTPVGSRKYGLDATPVVWFNDQNGDGRIASGGSVANENTVADNDDFVAMFFGQRDGGTRYWGLELNPTTTCGSACTNVTVNPSLLWRITGGDGATAVTDPFQALANTWSEPKKTRVRTGSSETSTHALIFGGGNIYALNDQFGNETVDINGNSTNNRGNIVYIVDATNGSLITSIGGVGTNAKLKVVGMNYPIPSNIAMLDTDGDSNTDRLYFGDLGGNVWRVDLKRTLTASSTGTAVGLAAKLADLNPVTNTGAAPVPLAADTRAFYFEPTIVQASELTFSDPSKPRYDLVLIGSGHRNHPKDVVVLNSFFAIRDYAVGTLDADADGVVDPTYVTVTGDQSSPTDPNGLTVITPSDLVPTQVNPSTGEPTFSATQLAKLEALQAGRGWRLAFTNTGEKVVGRARALAGTMLFTTFAPLTGQPTNACTPQEGINRTYKLNLYSGAAFATYDTSGQNPTYNPTGVAVETTGGIGSTPQFAFGDGTVTAITGGPQSVSESIELAESELWRRTYWYEQ